MEEIKCLFNRIKLWFIYWWVIIKTRVHVWYIKNETKIWMYGPLVLPVVAGMVSKVCKTVKENRETNHRYNVLYDRATGYYNQLKRPLTTSDWEKIMYLKRSEGLTYTEALIALNLVKN